jgi:adenylate cyclase
MKPVHTIVKAVPPGLRRLLAGQAAARLSERVHAAIARQQDASERLIGWVQLSVVTGFAVLFLLSPKTLESAVYQRPVGWAIAAYFLFTLFRLWLSYRGRLAPWFLTLSIVVDIVLLMGIIWSFHVDYAQPPAFYLKAPTLLYVFIFISIRALRFEARYVVLAGLVAALGWLLLVGYAIYDADMPRMLTRDYVVYLTSNSILLGAEFDKIISILLVTGILAVAIMRARRMLVQSVREEAAVAALSRFFSPEIADQIARAKEEIRAGEGLTRTAAILTTDIRGFTTRSARMAPNDALAALTEYQSRLVPVIQDHGGRIDKFLGDGILATFGAVAPSATYAADALRAAEAVCAAAEQWAADRRGAGQEPFELSVSVTTGPVIFGAVGDASRLEYTVIGDPVNLAAKLDKQNKVERSHMLTTLETFERAERQGYVPRTEPRRLPARRVEGVAAPLDLVILAQ